MAEEAGAAGAEAKAQREIAGSEQDVVTRGNPGLGVEWRNVLGSKEGLLP